MTSLLRRVRKLEARSTDIRGFVPHSKEWLIYWGERIDGILAGEGKSEGDRIPLAFFDWVLAGGQAQDIEP